MCVVAAGGACCALFSLSSRVCVAVCSVHRLPLHIAAQYSKSEAVIKALLDAYPDAIKAKDDVRCGRGRRVCVLLFSLSSRVCVLPCAAWLLPLHLAAWNNKSEAVIKALLDAYPDAIKAKVRCVVAAGGACCALFSLSSRVCVAVCSMGTCRSTLPLRTTSQRR